MLSQASLPVDPLNKDLEVNMDWTTKEVTDKRGFPAPALFYQGKQFCTLADEGLTLAQLHDTASKLVAVANKFNIKPDKTKRTSHYMVGVCYDGQNPSTYKGVEVYTFAGSGEKELSTVFNTGNPAEDYQAARFFALVHTGLVSCSSSIDHFVSDGGDLGEEN